MSTPWVPAGDTPFPLGWVRELPDRVELRVHNDGGSHYGEDWAARVYQWTQDGRLRCLAGGVVVTRYADRHRAMEAAEQMYAELFPLHALAAVHEGP